MNDGSSDALGIVELAEWCASMRDDSLAWFRASGRWVADTSDARLQRWFAAAAHRHAWHAELWQARLPAIPPADHLGTVPPHDAEPTDPSSDGERARSHRSALESMLRRLERTVGRVEPDLDPSTLRTISLVRTDVIDLLESHPTV